MQNKPHNLTRLIEQLENRLLGVIPFATDRTIEEILSADYDSLNPVEKLRKALDRLSKGRVQVDKRYLEEATIILDYLRPTAASPIVYEVLAHTYALAGRYSEAKDALAKTTANAELEKIVDEALHASRRKTAQLRFNPKQSYIVSYTNGNEKSVEQLISDDQETEVILVVDDISQLERVKDRFKNSIYTIETESEIHEQYEPTTQSRIRVVLKNNNNGHRNNALNMGIRKVKQTSIDNIFELNEAGQISSLSNYIQADKALRETFHPEEKIRIAFFCTTTENTHGVPVVMNNIAAELALDPRYEVSYITNNFDNNELKFRAANGQEYTFRDREEFTRFVQQEGIKFDVLHSHSWHIADYYKPFHTHRDNMDLPTFLRELGSPRFIYTDHSNPTEDERKFRRFHGDLDYLALSTPDKERFLYSNLLDFQEDWEKAWEATTILSKRQLMDLAEAVTFVSETQMHEEEQMIPRYHYQSKARVVRNGVDIGAYNTPAVHQLARQMRTEMGITEEGKVILYAGRLDEEKGIFDLARAAQMMNERGEEVTVIYLGSNGHGARESIQELSPNVRSIFPKSIGRDQRNRMAAMYALADVVTQPTWGECFNQVGAEALAMGTPIVVSDFSAPGEIYVRSGAALGCERQNPYDLADKLTTMLNDREVRRRTLQIGERLVRENLNVQTMGREYMDLYQTLTYGEP